MPFVSTNNLLVSTVYGTGAVLELCYVIVFLSYIPDKQIACVSGKVPTIAAAAYLRMAGRPPVLTFLIQRISYICWTH